VEIVVGRFRSDFAPKADGKRLPHTSDIETRNAPAESALLERSAAVSSSTNRSALHAPDVFQLPWTNKPLTGKSPIENWELRIGYLLSEEAELAPPQAGRPGGS